MTENPQAEPPAKQGASTTLVGVVGGVAVVALAVAVIGLVVGVRALNDDEVSAQPTVTVTAEASDAASPAAATTPAATEEAAKDPALLLNAPGVPVGPDGEALAAVDEAPTVRLDLFADYMCPYCGQFERQYGEELQGLVDDGTVAFVSHPIAFLDDFSNGTQYSTRAAQAALAVAQLDPIHYGAFNAALFAEGTQPEENTDGLSDEQIAEVATSVGVLADTVDKLTTAVEAATVAANTQAAFENGLGGTPTLVLTGPDGSITWDYQTPFDEAIAQVAGQ
jgi:protein-disulfide isomerase